MLRNHFLIMKVNYSEDNRNEAFLKAYPKVPAYPHFFVLERDGSFLHSQGTAELEEGRGYNEKVFLSFLTRWLPGAKGDGDAGDNGERIDAERNDTERNDDAPGDDAAGGNDAESKRAESKDSAAADGNAEDAEDAEEVLAAGLKRAAADDKRVLIHLSAPS